MIRRNRVFKKIIATGLAVALIGGSSVQAKSSIAAEVRHRLIQLYKDGVPMDIFRTESIEEMIKLIDDKYTKYMSPEESSSFQNGINRKFYGMGVFIKEHKDGILITEVIKDGPSGDSGILAGDIIVKVDDKNIKGMKIYDSKPLIVGEKDTEVKITVEREGEVLDFVITRGEVTTPTVEYEWLNDGTTAHIIIRSFGEKSADEFYDIVKKCKEQNAKNFIVDLRQNPGGYMDQALKIAGLFVGDKTVIYTDSKAEKDVAVNGVKRDIMITEPVTFLINENSASASEILSAAIKEYDGALFVGENTYGKGVAQGMIDLSDGGILKVTIKEFYSPIFRKINGVGIKPHVKVVDVNPIIFTEVLMDARDADNMFYEDTENKEIEAIGYNGQWAFIDKKMNGWEVKLDIKDPMEIKAQDEIKIKIDRNSEYELEKAKNNIELINGISGKRVEYNLEYTGGELMIKPKEDLVEGIGYILVMKPMLNIDNGFDLEKGAMQIIKIK